MKKIFFIAFIFIIGQSCSSSEEVKPATGGTDCLLTKETSNFGISTEFTYNSKLLVKTERKSNGKVISSTNYQYNGTNLVNRNDYSYTTGVKVMVTELTNLYQGNNIVYSNTKNYRETGALSSQITNSIEYDVSNNKTKEIIKTIDMLPSGPFIFETMYIYQYNSNVLIRNDFYVKDPTTNAFFLSKYSNFEYNSNGKLITQKDYLADNSPSSTTEYSYNANNLKIAIITKNSTGKITDKTIYDYDSRNNEILQIYEKNGIKSYDAKLSYEYDAKGNIVKKNGEFNNYFNSNTSSYQTTPFTTNKISLTNEYQCSQ